MGDAILAFAVVWLAASVQASLGLGLGLIAAPLLLLLEPRLVPGPLLAAGSVLTLVVAYRERSEIDFHGLGSALGGRLAGSLLAALVLTSISARAFELAFGGLVLLAVALSLIGARFSPTPGRAATAGALSGFMGTISSIGGPPLALLYQHESGPRIRATMSGYHVVGALISIAALSAVGRYGSVEIAFTLYLVPPVLLGLAVNRWGRRFVDRAGARPIVLGLAFVSALWVLIRGAL